jgi:hypothetical protein
MSLTRLGRGRRCDSQGSQALDRVCGAASVHLDPEVQGVRVKLRPWPTSGSVPTRKPRSIHRARPGAAPVRNVGMDIAMVISWLVRGAPMAWAAAAWSLAARSATPHCRPAPRGLAASPRPLRLPSCRTASTASASRAAPVSPIFRQSGRVLPARYAVMPARADDAHEEVTETVVKPLDVRQHPHRCMVLSGGRVGVACARPRGRECNDTFISQVPKRGHMARLRLALRCRQTSSERRAPRWPR